MACCLKCKEKTRGEEVSKEELERDKRPSLAISLVSNRCQAWAKLERNKDMIMKWRGRIFY